MRVRKWCFFLCTNHATIEFWHKSFNIVHFNFRTNCRFSVFLPSNNHRVIWEYLLLTTADTWVKKSTDSHLMIFMMQCSKNGVSIFSSVRSQIRLVNGMHVNKLQIYKHPLWPCCALPNGNIKCVCSLSLPIVNKTHWLSSAHAATHTPIKSMQIHVHSKRVACLVFLSLFRCYHACYIESIWRAACAIQPNKCNRLLKFTAHVLSIRYIHMDECREEPTNTERAMRERENEAVHIGVSVYWKYVTCISWCLLHRHECYSSITHEIPLPRICVTFTSMWNSTCASILPMCTHKYNRVDTAAIYTHGERERTRTGESYGHSHTVCIFVHCTVLFVPWLPQAETNRTQMYQNLSTLSQTNQSKMCSRSC